MASTIELITQRYTAPTCTLEVTGDLSPLSQISDRPLLRRLRFHLQILQADGQELIALTGMRSQLLDLAEAVQGYLLGPGAPAGSPEAGPTPEATTAAIYLQPEGLTGQRLFLGPLSPPQGLPSVRLGTLQLADLAAVLADLELSVRILPGPALPAVRRRFSRRYAWIGAGAAVVLVALGAGTFIPRLVQESAVNQGVPAPTANERQNRQALEAPSEGDRPLAAAPTGPAIAPEPSPTPAANQPEPSPGPTPAAPVAPSPTAKARPAPAAPAAPAASAPESVTPESVTPASPAPASPAPASPAPASPAPVSPASGQPPALPDTAASGQSAASDLAPAESAPEVQTYGTAEAPAAATANRRAADPLQAWLETVALGFQQRWQPPQDLRSPLEFQAEIAADGTLTRLTPQNEAARRPALGLPDIGSMVAAPPPGGGQRLRLVLWPSGEVTATLDLDR